MKLFFQRFRVMKFFFIIILSPTIMAQTFYDSHATYWYYRARLRNDFLLVGSGPGMSIPMQERGVFYYPYSTQPLFYQFNNASFTPDGQTAKWGDAMSDLGYYIGVLATEYKLLIDNGQSQSADSTIKELYYALWALNRMDMNADALYVGLALNAGLPANFDANPQTGNNFLNGFSIRDDVQYDFVKNNFDHFNYNGNQGFSSNIKINNSYNTSSGGPYHAGWAILDQGHQYQDYNGCFISQDNWYDALVGLSLVRKLVPQNVTYMGKSFQDGTNSLFDEAMNIAWRTYSYFNNNRTIFGQLKYPDGSLIPAQWGGIISFTSFAHSEIIGRMMAAPNKHDYYNPTEGTGNAGFHDRCSMHQYLNTGNFFLDAWRGTIGIGLRLGAYAFANHSVSGLPYTTTYHEMLFKGSVGTQHNSNVDVMNLNLMANCNCWYNFNGNNTGDEISIDEFDWNNHWFPFNFYHAQMLRSVLYGWESCGYGESNPFPDWRLNNEMYHVWNDLLSSAPCEIQYASGSNKYHTSGPYSFNNSSQGPMNPYYEWSTTSRLDHPQRRGAGNNGGWNAEYNGLDYMLYHNLYFLLRKSVNNDHSDYIVDFTNRVLTMPYPLTSPNTSSTFPWGSYSYPATIGAYEVINAQSAINSNGDVTMRAGKEIQLTDGFGVDKGATYGAFIKRMDCSDIFNQSGNYDNINGRTTGNGSSNNYPMAGTPTFYDSSSVINSKTNTPLPKKGMISKPGSFVINKSFSKNLSDNISVYPNPTNGVFSILVNDPDQLGKIEIQNAMGENVLTVNIIIVKENTIDISTFSPGLYVIKIYDKSNKVYIKKIVKN